MTDIFGGLLEFTTEQEFSEFLNNMDNQDAYSIIEVAIVYGQQSGLYTLQESHSLYQCLTRLKNNINGEDHKKDLQ